MPGSAERIWYLNSDGGATSRFGNGRLVDAAPDAGSPPDEWLHDPDRPVPFLTGASSAQIGGPDDYAGVETRGDVLVFTSEPLIEPMTQDPVERAEDVSVAFLLALERLSPLERAVFLLHDVFDEDYAAVAETLDRSEVACRRLYGRTGRLLLAEWARGCAWDGGQTVNLGWAWRVALPAHEPDPDRRSTTQPGQV